MTSPNALALTSFLTNPPAAPIRKSAGVWAVWPHFFGDSVSVSLALGIMF